MTKKVFFGSVATISLIVFEKFCDGSRTSQEVPSITQGLCQFGDDIPENRQCYVKPKQHLSSILP